MAPLAEAASSCAATKAAPEEEFVPLLKKTWFDQGTVNLPGLSADRLAGLLGYIDFRAGSSRCYA